MKESERIINEIAQGLRGLDEGAVWFSGLPQNEQKRVLREVVSYAMQAHLTAEDGREGVRQSGVKPTANPAVMISLDPPRERLGRIVQLPPGEYVRAFRVLVSAFAVADTRRRNESCRGTCGHSWHNLSANS
ncbi:DUF5958 family protein [Streptomyces sp. NPDC086023]|uniref:DUF5958 family protein n=1 Tax=Streptomyces sp. NPDC086023 TaxID=3365746 RepID=UPI0037D8A4FE